MGERVGQPHYVPGDEGVVEIESQWTARKRERWELGWG